MVYLNCDLLSTFSIIPPENDRYLFGFHCKSPSHGHARKECLALHRQWYRYLLSMVDILYDLNQLRLFVVYSRIMATFYLFGLSPQRLTVLPKLIQTIPTVVLWCYLISADCEISCQCRKDLVVVHRVTKLCKWIILQ